MRHIAKILLMLTAMFALSMGAQADTASQCQLMLWEGEFEAAVPVCRQAAEAGDAYAQNFLGVSYADGELVPQDAKQSTAWFQLAAEQGFVPAQTSLGVAYATGFGVARNPALAVRWWREAAARGDAAACRFLGQHRSGARENAEVQQFAARMFSRAGECYSGSSQFSGDHAWQGPSCASLVRKIAPDAMTEASCAMR